MYEARHYQPMYKSKYMNQNNLDPATLGALAVGIVGGIALAAFASEASHGGGHKESHHRISNLESRL